MKFAPVFVALLAAHPAAGLACSIEPDPRPAEVQEDDWARVNYPRAQAMVEVVAVEGSRRHSAGIMRVVRVYKGRIRPGQLLILRSVEPSLCGAGDFERSSRGLILIDRLKGRLEFQGYLPGDFLTRLDRLGLRPIGAPVRR